MLKFNLTKEQTFLCLCVRHIDFIDSKLIKKMYNELGFDTVFNEAKINGVTSIVAHSLIKVFGEDKISPLWLEEFNSINVKIKSYMLELDKVAAILAGSNIPLLALKNSGITRGMYPYYGSCPMGDVDVLVSRKDFRKAHAILTDSGYKLKFRSPLEEDNIEAAEHGGGAEYSVQLDCGSHLWFELQWRPVAGRWIQPDQEPEADELIERSIEIKGSQVRLLSPEDNLLQVALHTAKHSFVRSPGFRLHTDVDRIVTTQSIDWDLFIARVEELKIKTAVYISLAMAKQLIGTPIPDHVLCKIQPNRSKLRIMNAWLERVGIFQPDEPKWSKLGYIIFVSLLYDNLSDWLAGIFPSSNRMKEDYGFSNPLLLPYFHIKRIFNLIIKRVNT